MKTLTIGQIARQAQVGVETVRLGPIFESRPISVV